MARPQFITAYQVNSVASDLTSLVTPSFTPEIGELLIIKTVTEASGCIGGAATGTGVTITSQVVDATASFCHVTLQSGINTTKASKTITVTFSGTAGFHSMVVERWWGAQLAAAPATTDTRGTTATDTATNTTVAKYSVVSWVNGDFSAQAPGTPTYRSSAVQTGLHDKSPGNYVAYYAYQRADATGAQTFGVSSPATQTFTLVAIEIQTNTSGLPNNYQALTVGSGMSTGEKIR
jgi:hypothetical protein